MTSYFSQTDCYQQYIANNCIGIQTEDLKIINKALKSTFWDEPNSSLDWNNIAVIALIEAEQCTDNLAMRSFYIATALEALSNGINLDKNPLCAAHMALVHTMIGETEEALNIAYSTFINTLNIAYNSTLNTSSGLVYIPQNKQNINLNDGSILQQILVVGNYGQQSILLLSHILCYSQLVFYNQTSLRLLHLAAQLFSDSPSINLKLGISSLMSGHWEGLLYIQRARQIAPASATIIQALYLAYRDLNQVEVADFWLKEARKTCQQDSITSNWQWTKLERDSNLTYVPFQNSLIMVLEPSFRSIVTSVLVAEGNWFEKEMEFWRSWIKPGMTVIDVGANVGVYTFSAALQVGEQGRVLAVEPFSRCVRCLEETCYINQLSCVTICAGAASDRSGTAILSLQAASELNEIVDADFTAPMKPGTFEEVNCFTLDSLIEQHNIDNVDFLKVDAEGHELKVLAGSERILNEFFPIIVYENIAGSQGSNLPVAEFLKTKGYQLFQYKPYVQELIPIVSSDLPGQLNIIALPPTKVYGQL